MATFENVIGAVMIMGLLLGFGIYLTNSLVTDAIYDNQISMAAFERGKTETNFKTALSITEPETNLTMGILLANAIYMRKNIFDYNGKDVNVTEKLEDYLNRLYGEDNYYFEALPQVVDLEINFIFDGSNSLDRERLEVATEMPNMLRDIQKKINRTGKETVSSKVYVLGNTVQGKDSKCLAFDNADQDNPDLLISCKTLNDFELYIPETQYDSDLNVFKNQYGLSAPYDSNWINSKHFAKPEFYYDSDWAFGTAYASYISNNENNARLSIFFPVADELSTSSIPDICFNQPDYQQWVLCGLCETKCPVGRSMNNVEKATRVLVDNRHFVYPIISYNCDYDYDPRWNQADWGPQNGHWCKDPACPGCSIDGNGGVCFQPGCKDELLSQMNYIADQTNGIVFDVEELSTIKDNIQYAVDKSVAMFNITIGDKKDQERNAYIESLPMYNGLNADVKLWVYEKI